MKNYKEFKENTLRCDLFASTGLKCVLSLGCVPFSAVLRKTMFS